MLNLISDTLTSGGVAGFVAVGIGIFVMIFIVAVVAAVKRMKVSRKGPVYVPKRKGETATVQQRDKDVSDLAAALRERKEKMSISEQRQRSRTSQNDCPDPYHTHEGNKIVANSDGHAHNADSEERYDKIVGSLGEVDDEGCLDLDGVRLIVDDVAYSADTDSRDYSEIAKAVVLGDIINNPRFKTDYRKK